MVEVTLLDEVERKTRYLKVIATKFDVIDGTVNPAVGYSYREQNQVADFLATEGARCSLLISLELAFSTIFANDAIWSDILGTVPKKS